MSVATTATTRFEMEAVAPFRLDLTVWALRRRPGNAVDRWDRRTYRRAFPRVGGIADLAVRQVGKSEAARLVVTVTTDRPVDSDRVQTETRAGLRRMLGLGIDLGTSPTGLTLWEPEWSKGNLFASKNDRSYVYI